MIKDKRETLRFEYRLGTIMAGLRLLLVVAMLVLCYFFVLRGQNILDGFNRAAVQNIIFAVAIGAVSLYLLFNTVQALLMNNKTGREVVLSSGQISAPINLTNGFKVDILFKDITSIDSIQVNRLKFMRKFEKTINHRKLVIKTADKQLIVKSEALNDVNAYDELFENLVARFSYIHEKNHS